jgi:hypothetical protein
MGRPFMARQPESIEARKQYARLLARMAARLQPTDMRKYLRADSRAVCPGRRNATGRQKSTQARSNTTSSCPFNFERFWL